MTDNQADIPPPQARSPLLPLAPCPFCGAKDGDTDRPVVFDLADDPDGTTRDGKPRYEIYCYECQITTGRFDTEAEAIAAWNKRAPAERPAPDADRWNAAIGKALEIVAEHWNDRLTESRNPTNVVKDIETAIRALTRPAPAATEARDEDR